MARRNSAVLAGAFIVGIIILLGIFFTGYRMVQTRQHFARVQSELQSTKQAADHANAQLEDVQTKLKQSISESEQLKNKLDTAQSQLEEKQSHLKAMEGELESAKQAADQAQADAAKLETTTAQPPFGVKRSATRFGSIRPSSSVMSGQKCMKAVSQT